MKIRQNYFAFMEIKLENLAKYFIA